MKMIYILLGTRSNTKGRDYLSGGGPLLQLRRGPTAANSEGSEWEGLSEARDARGRIALAQGRDFNLSRGRWLANCVRLLGKCDGFADFVQRALLGKGDVVKRSGRQVNVAGVVEDAKVVRRGQGVSGVSGGEMGCKCCKSVEEGDGRACKGVRTGPESPLRLATMHVTSEIGDIT